MACLAQSAPPNPGRSGRTVQRGPVHGWEVSNRSADLGARRSLRVDDAAVDTAERGPDGWDVAPAVEHLVDPVAFGDVSPQAFQVRDFTCVRAGFFCHLFTTFVIVGIAERMNGEQA